MPHSHSKPPFHNTPSKPFQATTQTKPNPKLRYAPFEEARAFAHSLKLSSFIEWRNYLSKHTLPKSIPHLPNKTYKSKGWLGWADWLGFQTLASLDPEFLPFEQAKAFFQTLKIKGYYEWVTIIRRGVPFSLPNNIPPSPHHTYRNKGWNGYPDWLGQHHPKDWLPYSEAQAIVSKKGFKSPAAWRNFVSSDDGIQFLIQHRLPKHPDKFYRQSGWTGWGNWLGNTLPKRTKKLYLPFQEARNYARSLELQSINEWIQLGKTTKLPLNIPLNPARVYKSTGWNGMPDWLGYQKYKSRRTKIG